MKSRSQSDIMELLSSTLKHSSHRSDKKINAKHNLTASAQRHLLRLLCWQSLNRHNPLRNFSKPMTAYSSYPWPLRLLPLNYCFLTKFSVPYVASRLSFQLLLVRTPTEMAIYKAFHIAFHRLYLDILDYRGPAFSESMSIAISWIKQLLWYQSISLLGQERTFIEKTRSG